MPERYWEYQTDGNINIKNTQKTQRYEKVKTNIIHPDYRLRTEQLQHHPEQRRPQGIDESKQRNDEGRNQQTFRATGFPPF